MCPVLAAAVRAGPPAVAVAPRAAGAASTMTAAAASPAAVRDHHRRCGRQAPVAAVVVVVSYTMFLRVAAGRVPTGAAMLPTSRLPGYGAIPLTGPLNRSIQGKSAISSARAPGELVTPEYDGLPVFLGGGRRSGGYGDVVLGQEISPFLFALLGQGSAGAGRVSALRRPAWRFQKRLPCARQLRSSADWRHH